MPKSVRSFVSGVMNKDLDERLIPNGQYRDALNIEIDDAGDSGSGVARNRLGTTKIGDLSNVCGFPVDDSFLTIGALSVPEEFKIFYLVASDYFDGVFEYNEKSNVITRVLQSNKATPSTPSKLNFSKDYYVTGINYVEGFLYWTDNYNEPFGGRVSRWKSYYIDDARIDDDIKVIKAPPLYPPSISMESEINEENNIEKKFVQFAYRYKYIDDQYSAYSPFSSVAFDPAVFQLDFAAGNNKAMSNSKNKVNIKFETGNRFVKKIELILRDTKNSNTLLVESFDKDSLGINDDSSHEYDFSNNKTYTILPEDQLLRLYDNVPLKAKAQDVIGRRLVYGNYTQFYDVIGTNGQDIKLDYRVRYISSVVDSNDGKPTFRSDRDIEVCLVYLDQYGRMTTALTSPDGTDTVYIKPENSIHSNSLVVEIDHEPPTFATHYRVVVKQSKKNYYNVFPLLYYSQGVYRYFLINRSDVDKINVGEYVIFKSNGVSATLSNKKYKILEIESKSADFLANGSSQVSGVYFKVKVDSGDFPQSAVTSYSTSGYGYAPIKPINNTFKCVDKPVFYGTSQNGSALQIANNWQYFGVDDFRIKIKVTSYTGGQYYFSVLFISNANLQGQSNIPIQANIDIPITVPSGLWYSGTLFNIRFSTDTGFNIGDYWTISTRGDVNASYSKNVFGSPLEVLSNLGQSSNPEAEHNGVAVFPSDGFSGPIQSGAQIKLWIFEDGVQNPDQSPHSMTFTSSRYYENIEEWFYEDEIYSQWTQVAGNTGNPTTASSVYFRRGTDYTLSAGVSGQAHTINQGVVPASISLEYPMRMMVRGYNTIGRFTVNFYITQLENPLIAETEPIENDVEIYHETVGTYPIVNGKHTTQWRYDDFEFSNGFVKLTQLSDKFPHKFVIGDTVVVDHGTPASPYVQSGTYSVVEVPDMHSVTINLAWTSSGPAEGGKIALQHNKLVGTELELDQTDTTPAVLVINNPNNPNGTYNAYSFGNGLESDRILDDFNETTIEYSPRVVTVVKEYKQDVKSASVCYSNVYRFESGVNRLNEFNLARSNFKNLNIEYGSIQKLHARDNDLIVFQENKVSSVLYEKNLLSDAIGGGSITSTPVVLGNQIPYSGEWGISSNPESFATWGNEVFFTDTRRGSVLKLTSGGIYPIVEGMSGYFRDLFMENPDTMKIGIYDPYNDDYILCHNDRSSNPCSLSINRSWATYASNGKLTGAEFVSTSEADFTITSNTEWTMSVAYSAGDGWVTGFPTSGSGNQDVFLGVADNNTGLNRTAIITITFCGGLTTTFTIYQARGKRRKIKTFVFSSIDPDTNLTI